MWLRMIEKQNMCGSCHSGRALNSEIGVEYGKISIVVFFYCCCEMYFEAISRHEKKGWVT